MAGGKSSKQKTRRQLPDFSSGAIEEALGQISGPGGAFGTPREFLSTDFIPLAGQQTSALSGIEELVNQGSPLFGASEDALMQLLNPGDFTQSQGFQDTINAALERVAPGVHDPFSAGGGGSGGLESLLLGKGVAGATGQIAQDQHNKDRMMMLSAIGAIPQVRGQEFAEQQQLMGVGDIFRSVEGQKLGSQVGKQDEEMQRLMMKLQALQPFLNLSAGFGTSETKNQPGQSTIGTLLGLTGVGAGIYGAYSGAGQAGSPNAATNPWQNLVYQNAQGTRGL